MTKNRLKILFVEDLSSDVELEVMELRKEKLDFDYTSVYSKPDLEKALTEFNPDLIISDYMMPSFNGLQALRISKELKPEVPFILCTGSVNEEIAVACIKSGAEDYIIKEHMTRLPFAVKEALNKAKIQKEKRAFELLVKEGEEKLQSIFTSAPVGIGLVANRVLLEVNDTLCSLLGYDKSELIGKSSDMLYPDREEFEFVGREKYRQIAEKGSGSVETLFRCKDGTIINVILSSTPLDRKDHFRGVTFTVMDITARKKAENDLMESHRKVNTLIGNIQGMVYRCRNDNEWTMEFVSEGGKELTGYSPEELMNNNAISYNSLVHPDDRDFIRNEVQHAIEKKKHFEFTYRISRKDGEIRWVWEKGEGIYDNEGRLEFLEGFITDINDRKRMEESLRLSEEKFRTIAENLSDIIFITDKEGIVRYVSPSCSIFGYTQEEFQGRFFGDFLDEGEIEKAMERFNNALNSIHIANIVSLIFKRKDGSRFYAELSGSLYQIEDKPIGILGLIRDVTDKMERELTLRKLSRAVEQNPASIIITDTEGKIEYVNPKFCEVTGYSEHELIGMNPSILSTHEKTAQEYKFLWDTIKSGNDWKGEFHNRKKNGELYWESATISPITDEKEEITHFLGIKEDITQRKVLEEMTRESEKRYRELFLNNPIPTYIFDEDTLGFVEVNDATIEFYGFSREEFACMTLKDLRTEEDIPELLKAVKEMDSEFFHSTKMRHRRKNGHIFPVEITSHAISVKEGRRMRLVMANDISESVEAARQMQIAREKAEASDRLKTTFLNNISHEVRTPLNGILGFAEIMSDHSLSEDLKKESLAMLHESSNRLLDTITNYMDISLLTSGSMTMNRRDFIPGKILKELYLNFMPVCSARQLELILEIPENYSEHVIDSDPEMFRKIITHLMSNAVKFTDRGTIWIGYNTDGKQLNVFVRDTGIGIAKDSMEFIFRRFLKEERNLSRISEGSGLGLSIAQGLAEIMGDKIVVESEVGKGSCFSVNITLKDWIGSVPSADNWSETLKSKGDLCILVAEDDSANFYYMNALIRRELNARVIHATNGKEAVELFISNPDINLVLMDIKMPVMDGLEATRQIKAIKKQIPVIAVTAYAMSGDEERVLAAGCDNYLSKPISKKDLLAAVARYF